MIEKKDGKEINRYAKRFYNCLSHNGYTLPEGEEYRKAKEYVEVVCPEGHKYKTTPDNFVGSKNRAGKRCAECAGVRKLSHDDFCKRVEELFGGEFIVLGEYIRSDKTVKVRHNSESCSYYEWLVLPPNLTHKKQGCPKCGGNARTNTEKFKSRIEEMTNGEYEVLGEYVNSDTPIRIRHNNESCSSFIWDVVPFNFTSQGSRCPSCNGSKGESLIANYLKINNYNYERQYRFKGCKHKRTLPFDFVIFRENEIICAIEMQGIQHFEPVKHFGGYENFEVTRKRDSIKADYCKSSGIELLIVPYWEIKNINYFLDKKIKGIIKETSHN